MVNQMQTDILRGDHPYGYGILYASPLKEERVLVTRFDTLWGAGLGYDSNMRVDYDDGTRSGAFLVELTQEGTIHRVVVCLTPAETVARA